MYALCTTLLTVLDFNYYAFFIWSTIISSTKDIKCLFLEESKWEPCSQQLPKISFREVEMILLFAKLTCSAGESRWKIDPSKKSNLEKGFLFLEYSTDIEVETYWFRSWGQPPSSINIRKCPNIAKCLQEWKLCGRPWCHFSLNRRDLTWVSDRRFRSNSNHITNNLHPIHCSQCRGLPRCSLSR